MQSILKFFLDSGKIEKEEAENLKVKNILVVRQHNQIGDMLCSLPLFAALKKKYPDSKITLVASVTNYNIIYGDVNPYINDVIIFNKSTLLHLLRFFKKLRSIPFDLGIVPSTVSMSRTSHLINYISRAKVRVGVNSINGKKNKSDYLLNIKSDFNWDELKLHQTQRNLDIVRQVGCDLSLDEVKELKMGFSGEELLIADKFIKGNLPDKNKKIFAFHAGAGKIQNRWSVKNFTELISLLYKKYNPYVLINSGPVDKEVTDELTKNLSELGIENIILVNTIREIGAIISHSDLFITNDTGPMHVGAMVGAKVIGLFGPTNGYEWGPLNKNGMYIQSKTQNINDITVQEVYEKACELINK